ncbi:hypothetical protein CCY99_04715 [Helicobacter sp. 16-1353]|uniref:NAD-dependent epimerase/dehydratase family protein n=1 Tax=Helicobacter sp. 16-1353 TaxID=2004996 RepID=UPI000DCDDC20|nr:NAD(P)-dependent oxidoreductase [Helicobacter sp. 16-1353]RAX53991.1 hypothetical protein CCY99_04715 [Helicobacter sp. 16-1353]
MKTIFLTGGNGFIGRHIKEYFINKYHIFAPSSSELDLTNSNALKSFKQIKHIDFIIHSASYGITQHTTNICQKNILMYENLKNIMSSDTKMISFGSGAQYNRMQNLHKIKESDFSKSIPKDEYGLSKYYILRDIMDSNNIISLNLFGCFGKYEIKKRFISYCLFCALSNKPIEINENSTFSFLDVEDLCDILEILLDNFPSEKSINITPDEAYSMEEIAIKIQKIHYVDYRISKEGKIYTGDNSLLKTILPNVKFRDLESGIKKLYNYYKILYNSTL